jgi:hypothetical protein
MAKPELEGQTLHHCWHFDVSDVMTFGDYIGFPNITIKDASSTLAGPFCYIYE